MANSWNLMNSRCPQLARSATEARDSSVSRRWPARWLAAWRTPSKRVLLRRTPDTSRQALPLHVSRIRADALLNGALLFTVLSFIGNITAASQLDARGAQFIGFHRFGSFEKTRGVKIGELVLTSPVIEAQIPFNELITSWNADAPDGTFLKVEARAIYLEGATKFYTMGLWSSNPARFPRQSVSEQKDSDGDVSTDTLILRRPAQRLQIRLTLGGDDLARPKLKFLGMCLSDTNASPPALAANRAAWGTILPVPERSQMAYPNGKVLCSPTTVSMLLAYWSQRLHRPDLDHNVPEVADGVYDSQWQGTGNWSFNMAYAGSMRPLRAYVTRMSDLSELEGWIAQGIPVGLSVCYDRLRGKGPGPNGHLVVCVGFTPDGDPIINDPGTSKNVRKIFPRRNLVYAWAYSHQTAYLVYPEDSEIPKDRFGHWDSWTAHQRITIVHPN